MLFSAKVLVMNFGATIWNCENMEGFNLNLEQDKKNDQVYFVYFDFHDFPPDFEVLSFFYNILQYNMAGSQRKPVG